MCGIHWAQFSYSNSFVDTSPRFHLLILNHKVLDRVPLLSQILLWYLWGQTSDIWKSCGLAKEDLCADHKCQAEGAIAPYAWLLLYTCGCWNSCKIHASCSFGKLNLYTDKAPASAKVTYQHHFCACWSHFQTNIFLNASIKLVSICIKCNYHCDASNCSINVFRKSLNFERWTRFFPKEWILARTFLCWKVVNVAYWDKMMIFVFST